MYGWMGEILRVNLTNNEIFKEKLQEDVAKKFFGGRCLGAKILFDELEPGIDPLSHDNKLVFATGPLVGVPFAGNSRYVVMGKSPTTGIWGESHVAGFFGPELKRCGYDAIIIEGGSEKPVYLWIHNSEAKIKSAQHLWGGTTGETQSSIRKDLGSEKVRVACIGPGGEHLVRYASIMSDLYHAAGRCGLGAVMGSKKLKAIAVQGSAKIKIADEDRMKELLRKASKEVMSGDGEVLHRLGTLWTITHFNKSGRLPTKAFQKCIFNGADKISGETAVKTIRVRRVGCPACPVACRMIAKGDTPYKINQAYGGPTYETMVAFGSLCLNDNLNSITKANELCNKYGLDTISTGVTIAFAMECYEKGLLAKKDINAIDLSWGNHEAIIELIEAIAKRQGIGNSLAEGVSRFMKKIGRNSKHFALQVKGLETPMHEPRAKKGYGLSYATSNRGMVHTDCFSDTAFEREDKMIPELGITETVGRLVADRRKAKYIKISQDLFAIYDSLIVCEFTVFPGGFSLDTLVGLVSAVTGLNITLKDLALIGERGFNVCRAFNVREGVSRKDDVLPERLEQPLPKGPYKGESIPRDILNRMLDNYYEIRGWDVETGLPTSDKLEELGLRNVARDLQKLGKLPS